MTRAATCNRRRWPYLAAVVVVLATMVLLALVHGLASAISELSRDTTRPVAARSASAGLALRIEPWNARFQVNTAIAEAGELLAAGRVDDAYFLLLPHSTTVRGDALFTKIYGQTVAQKWNLDARKAHQQHAREQEGGALDEEDVFK